MKAERRHELKESDLAHALDRGRAYFQGHGMRIGLTAAGVIAVVLITILVLRSREAAAEDRWRQKSLLTFDSLEAAKQSLESLMVLVKSCDDDHFVFSALIEQGGNALRSANSEDALPDKDLNHLARQAFELLLERFQNNPLAFGVAHLGLATVEENEFALDEDLVHKDRAGEHLTAILDNPAVHTMPFYQMALERRKALDETFTPVAFIPKTAEEESAGPGVDSPLKIAGPSMDGSNPPFKLIDSNVKTFPGPGQVEPSERVKTLVEELKRQQREESDRAKSDKPADNSEPSSEVDKPAEDDTDSPDSKEDEPADEPH